MTLIQKVGGRISLGFFDRTGDSGAILLFRRSTSIEIVPVLQN